MTADVSEAIFHYFCSTVQQNVHHILVVTAIYSVALGSRVGGRQFRASISM